jgi:hypothetical protein
MSLSYSGHSKPGAKFFSGVPVEPADISTDQRYAKHIHTGYKGLLVFSGVSVEPADISTDQMYAKHIHTRYKGLLLLLPTY